MVSRGGTSPLRQGEAVACQVKVRALDPVFVPLSGNVAWAKPWDKKKATVIGIRFRRLTPEASMALRNLLKQRPHDWGVVVL